MKNGPQRARRNLNVIRESHKARARGASISICDAKVGSLVTTALTGTELRVVEIGACSVLVRQADSDRNQRVSRETMVKLMEGSRHKHR